MVGIELLNYTPKDTFFERFEWYWKRFGYL